MLYFYDGQVRRYITQIMRMLSNFGVDDGTGNGKTVPVMYGDLTRQVANIIRDNSENKLPSAPRMAVYITALEQGLSTQAPLAGLLRSVLFCKPPISQSRNHHGT